MLKRYRTKLGYSNENSVYDDLPPEQEVMYRGQKMLALQAKKLHEEDLKVRREMHKLIQPHREAKAEQAAVLSAQQQSSNPLTSDLVKRYQDMTPEQLEAVVIAQKSALVRLLLPEIIKQISEVNNA